MENRPTHAVITKKDITNGEELPGAHLELLDEDGNTGGRVDFHGRAP